VSCENLGEYEGVVKTDNDSASKIVPYSLYSTLLLGTGENIGIIVHYIGIIGCYLGCLLLFLTTWS
jgi:hypothetical protein